MNWSISDLIKTSFTDIVPVQKPLVKNKVVQDPS
jgi:hypothetical protein